MAGTTETTRLVTKEKDVSDDAPHLSQLPSPREAANLSSKWGVLLTSVGLAVGTGNVWRFPRILARNTGKHGSLQFLLLWIPFLFLWSMPLIILEYAIGRFTKVAAPMTFYKLLGVKTTWMGCWINAVNFVVSCHFSVLVSYSIFYLFHCILFPLPTTLEESKAIWKNFVEETSLPVVIHLLTVLGCAIVIWKGVESIEPVMKFLVPGLIVLLFVTFIWTLTLPNAWKGIAFIFSPDWDMLKNPRLWIDALSQNAYDTGAGWGEYLVIASNMAANQGSVQTGVVVPSTNNIVSLLCGGMIFSAVFALYSKISPGASREGIVKLLQENGVANTGLTFIWMPILFSNMTGGRVIASLFFLMLTLAGISSYIVMVNTSVQPLVDIGLRRELAVVATLLTMFICGIPSAVSIDFLALQDFVWGSSLVFSGLMYIYLFWRYGSNEIRTNLINKGGDGTDWKVPKAFEWLIKYILPIEGITLVVWWVIHTVQKTSIWYELSLNSFMTAVLGLTSLLLPLVIFNVVLWFFQAELSEWWRSRIVANQDKLFRCCTRKRQKEASETEEIRMDETLPKTS